MNSVNLVGNLTRDVEVRHTSNNKAVANFTVAINEGKDRDATFVDCTAWERQAEILAQYAGKGSKVGVSGKLSLDRWEDNEGNNRSKITVTAFAVTLCGSAGESGGGGTAKTKPRKQAPEPATVADDDIPF